MFKKVLYVRICFSAAIFFLFGFTSITAQTPSLPQPFITDFNNQKISDILLVLADVYNEQIIVDDSVTGTATFHFSDDSFESALNKFVARCSLFVEKKDGVYIVSRIRIDWDEKSQLCTAVDAEDVNASLFIKTLSRKTQKTIVSDFTPNTNITVRLQNATIEQILKLILVKENEYELITDEGGYYVAKNSNSKSNFAAGTNIFQIDEKDGLFNLNLKKAAYTNVIQTLFKKAKKEYSLMNKPAQVLENLYYQNKTFDELLHLINEQASSDVRIENNVYYIFDIQKKDVLKKYKTTVTVTLQNINVSDAVALIPVEYNATGFTKLDKNSNSVIVTGSTDEITPILDFLKNIDIPLAGRYYADFIVTNLDVKSAVSLFPENFFFTTPVIVPNSHVFVTQVTDKKKKEIEQYLSMIDKKDRSFPVHLKYIKSETLVKNIPPSITKDNITTTNDNSLVFFTGNEEAYNKFKTELSLIDKPQSQIKYQLLVIQKQVSDNLNWENTMNINKNTDGYALSLTSTAASLMNISFDVITQFGLQFAEALSAQIGKSTAKIMADTTLNGIDGESISFQNTNTYRYRDVVVDADSGLYTSSTKEITSGLVVKVKGWVSGDDMVTVDVTAEVSKQGSVDSSSSSSTTTTTNPPSTSEKSVTTNVRTQSGTPVVISGLLQEEIDKTIKKTPILGSIPLLGKLFQTISNTSAQTEMMIYLVPFVQKTENRDQTMEENIARYKEKYGGNEI